MKVTKIVCDKCGNTVHISEFSEFLIKRSVNRTDNFKTVDLCSDCEKILRVWLDSGNDKEVG